jgi:hypothetical protein
MHGNVAFNGALLVLIYEQEVKGLSWEAFDELKLHTAGGLKYFCLLSKSSEVEITTFPQVRLSKRHLIHSVSLRNA